MVFGGLIAGFGIRDLVRASASVDWPTVPGSVLASHVTGRVSGQGKDRRSTSEAWVRYEYAVAGTPYRNERIAYGGGAAAALTNARDVVDRYPPGAGVTVYYLPSDPGESVLEPGLRWQTWVGPGFGTLFVLVGCMAFVVLPRLVKGRT
jgi:hypothetical protein